MKSKGEQVRSWCYVVDCALGILYVLIKGNNRDAYNISDSNSIVSIREMADIIADTGNKKVVIDAPSEIEQMGFNVIKKEILDSSKLQALGWRARCDIRQGFEHTIKHIKEK